MNNIKTHFNIILPSMYMCAKWTLSFWFPHQAYAVLFCTTSATYPAYLMARNLISLIMLGEPVPVAARPKAWVCGRSPADIVGSNPTGGMDVLSVVSVLCCQLNTRPEESYRVWCVVVCDLETSRMRRPWPTGGGGVLLRPPPKKIIMFGEQYKSEASH